MTATTDVILDVQNLVKQSVRASAARVGLPAHVPDGV